jgi:hypothetical protein
MKNSGWQLANSCWPLLGFDGMINELFFEPVASRHLPAAFIV